MYFRIDAFLRTTNKNKKLLAIKFIRLLSIVVNNTRGLNILIDSNQIMLSEREN